MLNISLCAWWPYEYPHLRNGNGFLGVTLKEKVTTTDIDQLDLTEIKNFVHHKTLWDNEKTTYRMGKIFVNHISDNILITRTTHQPTDKHGLFLFLAVVCSCFFFNQLF